MKYKIRGWCIDRKESALFRRLTWTIFKSCKKDAEDLWWQPTGSLQQPDVKSCAMNKFPEQQLPSLALWLVCFIFCSRLRCSPGPFKYLLRFILEAAACGKQPEDLDQTSNSLSTSRKSVMKSSKKFFIAILLFDAYYLHLYNYNNPPNPPIQNLHA